MRFGPGRASPGSRSWRQPRDHDPGIPDVDWGTQSSLNKVRGRSHKVGQWFPRIRCGGKISFQEFQVVLQLNALFQVQ
jgi:hypothetical protein